MTAHALYRFFDHDGDLLYVGITLNPSTRWADHRDQKPWWLDVANVTLETYPDRPSVLAAEQRAIQTEWPRHNIQHRSRSSDPWRNVGRVGSLCATTPDPEWVAEDMPDMCHDYCEDGATYLPYRWHQGNGHYRCRLGHQWSCGWGHNGSGVAPENSGTPVVFTS